MDDVSLSYLDERNLERINKSMDLPEECWELICKAIDEDDYRFLESVSLVSTLFLSITNRVRSTFVVTDRTLPFLNRHLISFDSGA